MNIDDATQIMYFGSEDGGNFEARTLRYSCYPDGAPLISHSRDITVKRILLRPKTFVAFLAGLFWADALVDRGHPVPELILPLVPGSRQDRLNSDGDYLFTAKSVAQMINARNFPKVTILDPHSDVVSALIDRCEVIPSSQIINPPGGKYKYVIIPDAGAEKRANAVAKKLGAPVVHAWKNRDVATGGISGFGFDDRSEFGKDATALIVDDICDGGGTFVGLYDHMKKSLGVHLGKVDLYVTHGIFSQGVEKLLSKFRHVYCTDSVVSEREGVIEVPICDRLLKTGKL